VLARARANAERRLDEQHERHGLSGRTIGIRECDRFNGNDRRHRYGDISVKDCMSSPRVLSDRASPTNQV
jgi:hypothetical protein